MIGKTSRSAALILSAMIFISAFGGCSKNDSAEIPAETVGSQTSETAQAAALPKISDNAYINPDWSYGQVAIGGGGFVSGVYAAPEQGVYYARTDVGGAYYRTSETEQWTSMNYWVTADDRGLLGIDGLAYDPQSPNRVFLLAGTDYFSNGKTAVIISDDYGKTVSVVDVTDKIKVHGNGMGRGNGERIAVDPNNGNIIFAGGRTGGMIKSTDGGITWETVNFPVVSTPNTVGINGILFDPSTAKDGKTMKIYASVSSKDTAEGNLFVSEDGGESWNVLPDSINSLMPQRMKLDGKGALYVTYIDAEGPWNPSTGAIYRYNADGTADNISPTSNPFGDIVIDPNDGNKLVAVTSNTYQPQSNGSYGDQFFTSTDGGKTWNNITASAKMSNNGMSWIDGYAIHWCSSLALDPFNTGKITVNSGNGVFACDDIWAAAPEFYFDAKGIEETVPLDIVSIEGLPLMSAIGDYDGFVHEDIFTSAARHGDPIGTTTGITVAAKNTDMIARVGGSDSGMAFTCSTDGGKTWKRITKSPEPGKNLYGGKIAFNADGSILTWSPENGMNVYWTDDLGATWNTSEGAVASGLYLIGDPNDPNYVYGCGNSSIYISSDGGKTFKRNSAIAPSYSRICTDPTAEGRIFIANGAGLLLSEDHGESAELVPGIKKCEAVGLGKAKNDGDPLVIYIWGMTMDAEEEGLYMSEDNGASWSRVNDDLHNFGGTGNGEFVCGDMNIYGRCYMSTVGLGIVYFDKNDKS